MTEKTANKSDTPEEVAFILAALRERPGDKKKQPNCYPSPESHPQSTIDEQRPEVSPESPAPQVGDSQLRHHARPEFPLPPLPPHKKIAPQLSLATPMGSPKVPELFRRFRSVGHRLGEELRQLDQHDEEEEDENVDDLPEVPNTSEWQAIFDYARESIARTGCVDCPACHKTFTRFCNFKSHSRTHVTRRPYTCSVCNKGFLRKHDLNRHEKIHMGVKPFKCTRCGKGFVRKDALRRHQTMEPNVQKFRCIPPGAQTNQNTTNSNANIVVTPNPNLKPLLPAPPMGHMLGPAPMLTAPMLSAPPMSAHPMHQNMFALTMDPPQY